MGSATMCRKLGYLAPPALNIAAPRARRSLLPAALLMAALLVACGSNVPAPTPTLPSEVPSTHFTKTATSLTTAPAQLAAGIYSVAWHTTDGPNTDCLFFMAFIPVGFRQGVDPIPPNIFVAANVDSGTHDLPVPSAGMYLFQEASPEGGCLRVWSADLTFKAPPAPSSGPTAAGSPTAPDAAWVVLYVRNNSPTQVWDAVVVDGRIRDPGSDYSSGTSGAGCYSMPIGSHLVLLDRSGADPSASVLREILCPYR